MDDEIVKNCEIKKKSNLKEAIAKKQEARNILRSRKQLDFE
jgi:hypothetical protein